MKPKAKSVSYFHTKKFRETGFLIALVAIPLINFAIFWVYINFSTVVTTFQRYNVATGNYDWIGLDRYKEVFFDYVLGQDKAARNTFLNSFKAIGINLVILPLAYVCSYAFYKKIRFQKFFRVLFMLPSMISIVVLTMVFRYMFSFDFGPLAALFENLLGHETDWLGVESNHLWTLIWIFCIWSGMGTNVIMISGAMLRIPADIMDSCQIDGVGFWREAVSVVLPLVMPTIGIYFISIIASALTFTMQPMLLANNNPGTENKFLTVSWYIFAVTGQGSESEMLNASTVGIVFSLILMPFIVLARVISNKLTPKVSY